MATRSITSALALCVLFHAAAAHADDAPASQPAAKTTVASDTVDYKKLKELLPADFAGLRRTSGSGSHSAMLGMKLASAEGGYGTEGHDQTAKVTITDYGAMPGMMDSMTAWSKLDIDNDSDTEFTKTLKVGDYKAMETFKKDTKDGNITVAVGSRFVVAVESTGLDADALLKAVQAIDLKKLAELEK